MNKRSAVLVAAGLVLTLIVGGVAISVGLTGPTSTQAALRTTRKAKPIVKVRKRTVTVHRQGAAGSSVVASGGLSVGGQSGDGIGDRDPSDHESESTEDHSSEDADHGDDREDEPEEDHEDEPKDEPEDPADQPVSDG